MSLLHLVHKNVVIKFAASASPQFNSEASYAFRLAGVDAMGFLQIQDLKPDAGHETSAEPYWINKDLVREIHELDLAKVKETVQYTGPASKPCQGQTSEGKACRQDLTVSIGMTACRIHLRMDQGLQVFQYLGRRNGLVPQDDGSLLVNVEIGSRFRAGQDNQGELGPDFVHFLQQGIARNVRQVKINQHCGPLIGALIESKES